MDVLFECDLCQDPVILTSGPGRTREGAGGAFEIPSDFPTATCQNCGEIYLNSHEAELLDVATMRAELKEIDEAIASYWKGQRLDTIKWLVDRAGKQRISRWILSGNTTPSGKSLFICSMCGRTSIAPDKNCPEKDCAAREETFLATVR